MHPDTIIEENRRRMEKFIYVYNPETGEGSSLPRKEVFIEEIGLQWLVLPMILSPLVLGVVQSGGFRKSLSYFNMPDDEQHLNIITEAFENIRLDTDFEYWAIKTVKIKDKESGQIIPFRLNYPQRKLLYCIEVEHSWANKPIRIDILKARQWGGSTLTEIIYNWYQIRKYTNWNSIIITDVEAQARNIRGMCTRLSENYPKKYGKISLMPFEGSNTVRVIKERGNLIAVGSMQKPEASRSFDFQMCHLSEVGLWKKTLGKQPKDLIQAIRSGVLYKPGTSIILESTAKGTGNFWYHEWMDAKSGKSGYYPFFVGFWEIELYQIHIDDHEAFIEEINSYDSEKRKRAWYLWSIGATLEAIKWYFNFKDRENYDDWRMASEFPATDTEAFQSTGNRVFHPGDVQRMRVNYATKYKPVFVGDINGDCDYGKEALDGVRFVEGSSRNLKVWRMPECGTHNNRYVVSVDIGGTTDVADFSTIRVLDREPLIYGGVIEAIATWKGHLPQDLVAWKACQLAMIYDNAMLVIEQNSLDNKGNPDHFLTILNEIKDYYENIYCRTSIDRIKEGAPVQYGFHVNSQTKPMIVGFMSQLLRTDGYIEYDDDVLVEYDQYELKENGQYGAVDGAHDDLAMATMEGVWVGYNAMSPCTEAINGKSLLKQRKVSSEATF